MIPQSDGFPVNEKTSFIPPCSSIVRDRAVFLLMTLPKCNVFCISLTANSHHAQTTLWGRDFLSSTIHCFLGLAVRLE